MDFEIDDVQYRDTDVLPQTVARALEVVRALPDGKLLNSRRLAQEVGVTPNTLNNYVCHPALAGFRVVANIKGRRCLYGNEATITAFKERMSGTR